MNTPYPTGAILRDRLKRMKHMSTLESIGDILNHTKRYNELTQLELSAVVVLANSFPQPQAEPQMYQYTNEDADHQAQTKKQARINRKINNIIRRTKCVITDIDMVKWKIKLVTEEIKSLDKLQSTQTLQER